MRHLVPSLDARTWVLLEGEAGAPVVTRKADNRLRYTYKIERTFAWLGNFRWLLIRWERVFGVYQSFLRVAVLLVSLRRAFPASATSER
jgi:hypothetical protein